MNTMCEASQPRYDRECPERFQSAEFLLENGQARCRLRRRLLLRRLRRCLPATSTQRAARPRRVPAAAACLLWVCV